MELKSVSIRRQTWLENKPVTGEIEFQSPIGEIKLILTQEDCHQLLKLFSARLVAQTQAVANNMTASIIEQSVVNLEDKSDQQR